MLKGYTGGMVTLVTPASEQTIICPHCKDVDSLVRHGHTKGGNQRYRCRACSRTFCLNPGTSAHPDAFKQQVLAACHERASLRGVCRVFGISRNTLADWLEKKAAQLPPLSATGVAAQRGDKVEMDELWSFVQKKTNQHWICSCLHERVGGVP
jgi:transposase-like protein